MNQPIITTTTTKRDRPPTVLTIHKLMDRLFDLRERLSHTKGNVAGTDVIGAYDTFIRASEAGRSCPLAMRARSLFENNDYQDVKNILCDIMETIEDIENPDTDELF